MRNILLPLAARAARGLGYELLKFSPKVIIAVALFTAIGYCGPSFIKMLGAFLDLFTP